MRLEVNIARIPPSPKKCEEHPSSVGGRKSQTEPQLPRRHPSLPLATSRPIIGLALAEERFIRFRNYAPCRAFAPCVLLSKLHEAGSAGARRLHHPGRLPFCTRQLLQPF